MTKKRTTTNETSYEHRGLSSSKTFFSFEDYEKQLEKSNTNVARLFGFSIGFAFAILLILIVIITNGKF